VVYDNKDMTITWTTIEYQSNAYNRLLLVDLNCCLDVVEASTLRNNSKSIFGAVIDNR